MPIWLAILQIAGGLQRARSGDRLGGFAQIIGPFTRSFSDTVSDYSVPVFHSFGESDVGVRRNYM